MRDLSHSMLDQLRAGFAAHGWPVDDLDRYRMDGAEGDPAPAPAPEPAPAPTPAAAADPDPFDTGADTFPRDYVEKLRTENARYRTEAKQARDDAGRFTSAFDGIDDQLRDTFLALPQALKNDPKGTAAWMREQAEAILAEGQTADPREGEHDEERPLTKKEVDALFAQRDQQAAIDRQTEIMKQEVEALGFGWKSPESDALLQVAASHTNGDIAKAHAVMAGWAQAAIDQYVGGKKTTAAGPQPVPAAGQQAAATVEAPKTFKDADRAAMAHIAAVSGTPGR